MHQLTSLLGLFVMIGLAWLLSLSKRRFPWRVVVGGLVLQFAFAVLILKTPQGQAVFDAIGDFFRRLQQIVEDVSLFQFRIAPRSGEEDLLPPQFTLLRTFAFGILPTIIFFSSLMAILYHVGVMQWIVRAVAWMMRRTLGTSGAETLSAAANIFVGQTEAPLVIRPYIAQMTYSELNAVMVGGFATIAGGVLAAYVAMGIDAGHLVTASVISAPAALLIAKVMVPETETPATLGAATSVSAKRCVNVIEAAADGALDGLKLALNVGAMLLVFTALIAMCNAAVGWVGGVFGYVGPDGQYQWSLSGALGMLLMPVAWVMGIPWEDSQISGEILGLRTVLNEFVAYEELAQISNPLPGALAALQSGQVDAAALGSLSPSGTASVAVPPAIAVDGLERVVRAAAAEHVSDRTKTILTYALCGFANFASIGIQIGGIGGIAPERRSDLAKLGLRAMIGGTLACFMTACVAGILLAD